MKKIVIILFFCGMLFINSGTIFAETENTMEDSQRKHGIVAENGMHYFYENNKKFMPVKTGVYEKGGKYYYFFSGGAIKMVPEAGIYVIDDATYYFYDDSSLKSVKYSGYKLLDGVYYYMKAPYTIDDSKARKVISNDLRYYYDSFGKYLTHKDAKLTSLKRNGSIFEIRKAANQKVGGYDTLQGSCTDGTYAYYVLYNRNVEKCKIVKTNLKTNKVVKISKVLNIAHGNGLTYNANKKVLVAVHNTVNPKRLSVINPSTLKIKKTVNVKIPSKIKGATATQIKNIKKFGSISYNPKQGNYIVLLSSSHNLLFLDEHFVPVQYVKLSQKPKGVYQCIDTTEDHVLIGMSPGSGLYSNVICVYEWDGTYRFMIKLKQNYELESIFHVGKKLYAGFYRATRGNRRNYVYRVTDHVWEL